MLGCGVTWSQRSRRPTTSNCRPSSATPTRTRSPRFRRASTSCRRRTGRLIFSLPSSPRILRSLWLRWKLWEHRQVHRLARVKLFVDRALARRQDDSIPFARPAGGLRSQALPRRSRRPPGVPAELPTREATAWVDIAEHEYLLDWLPYHLMGAGRGEVPRPPVRSRLAAPQRPPAASTPW